MFDTANKFKHISMLLCQPKACLVKRYLYKHRAKPSQNTVTCIKSIFFFSQTEMSNVHRFKHDT